MAEEGTASILQFAPFQSLVDESFWHKFSSLKLNVLKTDDSPLPICGFYSPCSNPHLSTHLSLFSESLLLDSPSPKGNRNKCPVPGTLYNTNTMEAYRSLDRHKLLTQEAQKIWDCIKSGKVEDDCRVLSRFLVIAFADLKKWKFHYWFAFPAISLNPPALIVILTSASKWFTSHEAESVSSACNAWRNSLAHDLPFFLICVSSDSQATILGLNEWEKCGDQRVVFAFYDPCHLASNPGWPLRNYLAFIATRFNRERIHFLCYRETRGFADLGLSLVGEALVNVSQEWKNQPCCSNPVGWELNKGKLVPKSVNLAESMDSSRLAVAAADLNLKLMRWRAMPILDLEKLASTKCLLLGAGTLGCQVARMLMAWGVRKITFLDSGRVSLSNPLRQSLYTLEDCDNGGEHKAIAAVNSLKKIFPAVEAEGVVMVIPMPGHPVTNQEEESVVSDCTRLQALVDSHDVVFLLTDTRESRWLPSLMCASSNKHVTITAALGFESFLVMRHGPGPLGSDKKPRLGCYFCNDVVAPTDSTANRTLDQQCTVTRPGVAPIASSLAVEMLVNVLHHPLGIEAGHLEVEEGIGNLPHQIRGSLHQFSQMALVGYSSECCSACSETVVSEYNRRGIEFVLQAINQPSYLEDLTGMTALKISANSFEVEWDDNDDDCPDL